MKRVLLYRLMDLVCVVVLAGCSSKPVITMPTTARPYPAMVVGGNNGSIFQVHSAVMLFEEPLARGVGDILTVEISENTVASGKSNTTANRTASFSTSGSADDSAPAIIRALLRGANYGGDSASKFKGDGSFENKNDVTANLAVTVIDVLSNGNLLIGGDKRVLVNDQQSILRLTGVLNRKDLKAGNVITSKKIADARLELVGEGVITDANSVGWMQKFFLSVNPY